MELGITPVVSSGMIMQLLSGLKVVHVDQNDPEQRHLWNGLQKLMGMVWTIAQAVRVS